MTIGERIKEARKNAGLAQRELAEKSGVATGTIQQYELGKRQPRIEQLQAIADALGVSFNYLAGIPSMLNIANIPPLPPISNDSIFIDEFIRFIEMLGYDVWLCGDLHQFRKGEKIAYITQNDLKAIVRTSRIIVEALVQDLMDDPANAPDAPIDPPPEAPKNGE